MDKPLLLTDPGRSTGSYLRKELKGDVLYSFYRYKHLNITFAKKSGSPTKVKDALAEQMVRDGIITSSQKEACENRIWQSFATLDQIAEYDDYSVEALYTHIHSIRRTVLGAFALEQAQELAAHRGTGFDLTGCIDQRKKRDFLLGSCSAVILTLCQAELFELLQMDVEAARQQNKDIYILVSPESGKGLPTQTHFCKWLGDCTGIRFLEANAHGIAFDPQLQEQIEKEDVCLFVYGEDGLMHCRSLCVDAVVYAIPTGYYAQAVTNQLGCVRPCVVYVPRHFDITQWVRLRERTRLSYWQLAKLWEEYGDDIYACSVQELYVKYPKYFVNIYQNGKVFDPCPIQLELPPTGDTMAQFDHFREQAIEKYLNGFDNVRYTAAYFDENLEQKPISSDSSQKQKGILVHAVRVKKAQASRVIRCEKNATLRQMFTGSETGIVSNFLFFMTPKLAALYNDLRNDRPMEQANVATGHLDYMLCHADGKRIETFPLFRKTCIAMKENGEFLFFNFRLGGGSVSVAGQTLRWEETDVDVSSNNAPIRVYTPYYSLPDREADRETYRKLVGEDRINLVILQDKIRCIRKGDVVLPSVGVVISLSRQLGQGILDRLPPLADGYYDASNLELTVLLDAPRQIDPAIWQQVRWAYGGGLSLILDGVGLCDGDHMEQWFEADGWQSPLSRQTQESTLHQLVKHPRTAIGTTENGDLVVLVFSGRTWRSTGADYNEMCQIARKLFGDVQYLMNMDGGGSAVLGMVTGGSFMELSCPSTSTGSCVGMVRPINTVLFIPVE